MPLSLAAFAVLLPAALHAQTWTSQAAVEVTGTASSNGALAPPGQERKDIIGLVRPSLRVVGQGADFKVGAQAAADWASFARDTQPDRVSPTVHGDVNATLVRRFLFLDSSVDVRQAEADPYAPRVQSDSTQNRQTQSTYRLSPYINYELSPLTTVTARYEDILSRSNSETLPGQRYTKLQMRTDRKATPLGGALEIQDQDVRISGKPENRWKVLSLKAIGDMAVNPETTVGLILGQERSTYRSEERADTMYGAHLEWSPGVRTLLQAEVDHRFFGVGWELSMRHRMPFSSFEVRGSRGLVTSATYLGVGVTGSDLGGFLNSILTTQYPDAAVRGAQVNDIMSNRGVRATMPGAIDSRAEYAQLQSGASATWVIFSQRNLASFSVYRQSLSQLSRPGDTFGSLAAVGADNRQTGAALDLNHRLTPQMSIDWTSNRSRISGLAARLGEETVQRTHRLSLIRTLSPRTGMSVGLQYDTLETTATGIHSYVAKTAFIGMNHRF